MTQPVPQRWKSAVASWTIIVLALSNAAQVLRVHQERERTKKESEIANNWEIASKDWEENCKKSVKQVETLLKVCDAWKSLYHDCVWGTNVINIRSGYGVVWTNALQNGGRTGEMMRIKGDGTNRLTFPK